MNPYVDVSDLPARSTDWLKKIDAFNTHKMTLNASKAALLVIDMQKFFLDLQLPSFTVFKKGVILGSWIQVSGSLVVG